MNDTTNKAPFFIVGVQRSGTTLLSVMLEKHPDVYMEKKSLAFRLITCFQNLYDLLPFNLQHDQKKFTAWLIENDTDGRLANLIDYKKIENYKNLRQLISESIDQKTTRAGKQIWGDKSPNLQHYLDDLILLIPNAKILHVVRDGRANAHSMSRRSYQNLALSAQRWVDGNIAGMVNQNLLGEKQYKMIHYEKILQDPESEAKAICEFLDIPFASEMLTLSDEKLARPKSYVKDFFDQSKIKNWQQQLTAKQINKIENIQGPLLKKMAYELQTPPQKLNFQLLSLRQKICYRQIDNFKQLFKGKKIGMKNKELIEIKIPLRLRVFTFFKVLTRDLFSLAIFKALFSRLFYKQKTFYPSQAESHKNEPVL